MKKIFPKEFSDLLNQRGLKAIADGHEKPSATLGFLSNLIRLEYVEKIINGLNDQYYPRMQKRHRPIPSDSISKMRRNYSEQLGKTMRMKTLELNSEKSIAYKLAADTGLMAMLHSESYKKMGEMLLSSAFGSPIGNQVICYENRDYVSPHNDHHPEDEHLKKGYYDIHLMLSNNYVNHQSLVYEEKAFLNKSVDISVPSAIAVYRLPFWHYTTPLEAKKNHEDKAQRWLLLGSFEHNAI